MDAMLAMLMPRMGTTRTENPPKMSVGFPLPSPSACPPGNPGSPPPNGSPEGTSDPGPEPPDALAGVEDVVVDSPPPPLPGTMPESGPFAIMS